MFFLLTSVFNSAYSQNGYYKPNRSGYYPSQQYGSPKETKISTNENCKEVFKQYNHEDLDSNCSYVDVRDIVSKTKSSDGKISANPREQKYMECVGNIKSREFSNNTNFTRECTDFSFSNAINNGDFDRCNNKVRPILSASESWEACSNFNERNLVLQSSYITCLEKTIDLNISSASARRLCDSSKTREKIYDGSALRCFNSFSSQRVSKERKIEICSSSEAQKSISKSSFNSCLDFLANNGLNDHAINACIVDGAQISYQVKNPSFTKCLKKGFAGAYDHYFDYRRSEINSGYNQSFSEHAYKYLINDCLDTYTTAAKTNNYFSYIQDINVHTNNTFNYERFKSNMFGLSALRYNPITKNLLCLSDSKQEPKIYEFNLLFSKESNNFIFTPKKINTLNVPKERAHSYSSMDPEGMILFKNGDIILSSEQKGDAKKTDLIFHYDKNGKLVKTIDIPENFVDLFETKEETREYDEYKVFTDGSYNRKSGKWVYKSYYITSQKPFNCIKPQCTYQKIKGDRLTKTTEKVQGLSFNKGLESLGMTEDEKFIFTGNEGQLDQDSVKYGAETVRIVRYDNSTGTPVLNGQFAYKLEDERDNGLVDVLPLTKDKVLVLERSYDNFKDKITARIFLVNLTNATDITDLASTADKESDFVSSEKTLLLDLDEMLPEMSPGFRKLDNFEGMTFGPNLPDGSRTLVLVTDNNGSQKQRTIFLILKVKKNLL